MKCINKKELFYQTIQEFTRENMDEKNILYFYKFRANPILGTLTIIL
jgi:hypothetical protein